MTAQVTELLEHVANGSRQASDELLPLIYEELRRLARARMAAEKPGLTLQATALVHEAYLRLVGDADLGWDSRGHFFAAAAEAMRRILIERARRAARQRHGGGQKRVTLEDGAVLGEQPDETLLVLDEALTRLEAQDARMAQVVKLRYFAGMNVEESAGAMDLSPRTVNRLWTAARAWLRRELARQ
ncbi:MAG: ECF-type sigma factor [Pseudomonadota bacterium]